jgi:hypothetical protein
MKTETGESPSLTSVLESVGKKLTELRQEKGFKSHADFAANHNLPPIHYWRMEKGKTNMTIKSLQKVLAIHGLSVEDLFEMIGKDLNGKK